MFWLLENEPVGVSREAPAGLAFGLARQRRPGYTERVATQLSAWLVKEEPANFAWAAFAREGVTVWSGVRNYQARNHLRAMPRGDPVLYYHSGKRPEIVGLARVAREAYPDPTARSGDWSAVDLEPVRPLLRSVTLAEIKRDPALAGLPLLRQPRLSVMPVSAAEFARLLALAGDAAEIPTA